MPPIHADMNLMIMIITIVDIDDFVHVNRTIVCIFNDKSDRYNVIENDYQLARRGLSHYTS